jgi:endonuclease YncB( thermonuclease family)
LGLLAAAPADTLAYTYRIEGRVLAVHDGDTITILDQYKRRRRIRLDAIDAPEMEQPYGPESRRHLTGLVGRRDAVAECYKTDRYRRQVCRVLIDGTDVCLAQLRAGMAWTFWRFANDLPLDRHRRYTDAQSKAKAERRGLWADSKPIAPWDWRDAHPSAKR